MKLEKLNRGQIAEVYKNCMTVDFPQDELKPFSAITAMLDREMYDCLGLFEGECLLAYGFLVRKREGGYLLLDYLGVIPECRNRGIGSLFLQEMAQYYGAERGILLECECERTSESRQELEMRRRREEFYRRNGCVVTRTKSRLFGVEYDILYLPLKGAGEKEIRTDRELEKLYRLMFPAGAYETYVRIWNRRRRMERVFAWNGARAEMERRRSLLEALGIGRDCPRVISLVGGGGKTSTMYQLADELAEQGKRVLVTTTTHIRCPREGQVSRAGHVRELSGAGWEEGIVTAGTPVRDKNTGVLKLSMMDGLDDVEETERLLRIADVILIEADGARGLPLKVPAGHEPVIVPQTELVIACAGIDSVGQTFGDICFRFAEAGEWLGRQEKDPVTAEDVARILTDERGSRKNVTGRRSGESQAEPGGRDYRIVINKADTEEKFAEAVRVIRAVPEAFQEYCAVTSYQECGDNV